MQKAAITNENRVKTRNRWYVELTNQIALKAWKRLRHEARFHHIKTMDLDLKVTLLSFCFYENSKALVIHHLY